MNKLGGLSPWLQWLIALILLLLFLSLVGLAFVLPFLDWRWVPLLLVALPLMAPLESLLLAPLYTLIGRFRYFSALLFATRRSDGGLDLHVGTLFDYVVYLRWADRGPRAARRVTAELLEGLLAITREVEQERLSASAPLVATSYFFSDRTLVRLGFEVRSPPAAVVQNLLVASLSIALRLSFTRGRPAFPDLGSIRQAIIPAGKLADATPEIRRLLGRLQPSTDRQR